MIRIRRLGATLALAGILGTGLALSPTPLSAAPTNAVPTVTVICDYIAQAIAFLELKPPSPFRDFLLATLRRAQERYCA
jgi:hypothetical protein